MIRGMSINSPTLHSWRDRWVKMNGWQQLGERRFEAKKSDDKAEIYIYDQIGLSWWDGTGVSASQFVEDLKELGDVKTIDLHINSPGGDVYEADAIYSNLNQHKATVNVFIDGLAASAASYIAMAGDSIAIAEHAKFMIHNAWGMGIGNANDFRKLAEQLDVIDGSIRAIYAARSGNTDKKLKDWMDAETWFTGQGAVDEKFADSLIPVKKGKSDAKDSLELMRMRLALAKLA